MAAAGAPPVDLAALERAAEAVLGSAAVDPAARAAAHAQLMALGESLSNIGVIQYVLDNSANSCAIVAVSSALQKLVTEHWNSFTEPMRVEIRALRARPCGARAARPAPRARRQRPSSWRWRRCRS